MKIPFNMTVNSLRLDDGEQVIGTAEALRKKGIFGNRYGELYVTNRRVAFVKATARVGFAVGGLVGAAISAAANSGRGKKLVEPWLTFDRQGTTATKAAFKKTTLVTITNGLVSERFMVSPESLAALEAAMPVAAG